ncbi:HAD-IIB family hydrolase [Geminicoccus harenae]|uniref:HAD-IIB family hydrolase n=1 Tax=Geminicoccus harenae TaxID=2498453 RepID=UPI00168BF642|nr:HAD-IIB family hydrolase [Geminicoccus harenae]
MQPLAAMPAATRSACAGLFTDIDDTITTEGRLTPAAYAALGRLQKAGITVVPITGRPAGWCDMVARFWPVDGVVGENGAFSFRYDHRQRRMIRRFAQDEAVRAANRARLVAIRERVLAEVPGAAVASDQLYRETDLAIDFCEDVPPLPREAVDRIVQIFEEAGAVAKVSSIHVNGWFGDHDKLTMSRIFALEALGIDLAAERERFIYAGDSPNDAPMFGWFPNAVGVANVLRFADRMPALPAYVTPSEAGAGFVELVDAILEARA